MEFDPAKDAENVRKHGISLARASDFELGRAQLERDDRREYGEDRLNALGYLDDVLHSLTFTVRHGTVRAISLRIASRKERRVYAECIAQKAD